jgi:hypothetical protein
MSKMRSFQLFHYSPPEKTAADYTEVEKEQFREQFRPIAKRYRVYSWIYLVVLFSFFALLFYSATKGSWVTLLFIGLVALFILLYVFLRPLCPACKRGIDGEVRTFCPVCGGKVERRGFMKMPYCSSCDIVLRRGRSKNYDVRCCTHCGVFLDGKGI